MEFFQKIKDSPYYLRIKNSLDYQYCRKQFLVYGGIVAGITAVFVLLLALTREKADPDVAIYLLFALFLVGYWLYTGYQWLELFLHMDRYIFFQAKLDQPTLHSGRYSSAVSFTVTFTDRQGKELTRQTAALFSSSREPLLEEYNNKTIQLAYNEEMDRLVILRKLEG